MKKGCLSIIVLVLIVAVAAFVTNPSEAEIKAQVKQQLTEKVEQQISAKDSGALGSFGSKLGSSIFNGAFDYMADVKVDNKYLYSTFDCTVAGQELAKGVVVFGKVIVSEVED